MRPWKQIATPHEDVLKGTFQQAEFAADLNQVALRKAAPEYQDAEKFFARTYVTEGMGELLGMVARRFAGQGGEPVIELQTSFGGGKTHTLLAVWHLATRACAYASLGDVPAKLAAQGITDVPHARVAVLDGTSFSPGAPSTMNDGTVIRTLWGHLAWRLLGKDGYERVRACDANGTAPGTDILQPLLDAAAPCAVLMDELVVYYRQLSAQTLSAGTMEANVSFLQNLTAAVKSVPRAVMLVTLLESETEAGGAAGTAALQRISNVVQRVARMWKAVTPEESFSIVRRRLFKDAGPEEAIEETCQAFRAFYTRNRGLFPPEVTQEGYLARMRQSYPLHPEVFDRLYQDWSALPNFQKTRGVLRYLAVAVHRLWQGDTARALILPGDLPLGHQDVKNLTTQNLNAGWDPVIDGEVDGAGSAAARIDAEDTRFGAVRAAVRAARTVLFATAPRVARNAPQPGMTAAQAVLGCATPEENAAVYQDVLGKMRDTFHYFNVDGDAYWFNTVQNLRRQMEARKTRQTAGDIRKTIEAALLAECPRGGVFGACHIFAPHADVADDAAEAGVRLVALPPEMACAHDAGDARSRAFEAARAYLERRGTNPRVYRQRLVFLAPDINAVTRLADVARTLAAWREIVNDIQTGRFEVYTNVQEAEARRESRREEDSLKRVVRETYMHLLVPCQEARPTDEAGFTVRRLSPAAQVRLAEEAGHVLRDNEDVIETWCATQLKSHLESYYFVDGATEVAVKTVAEDLAKMLYMPRLKGGDTLQRAIELGVDAGDFGFAAGKDADGTYRELVFGEGLIGVDLHGEGLLVTADAVRAAKPGPEPATPTVPPDDAPQPVRPAVQPGPGPVAATPHRYYGTVKLDPDDPYEQFGDVIENIVKLLIHSPGTRVTVKVDVSAENPNGFTPETVRNVRTNAGSLNLGESAFEG